MVAEEVVIGVGVDPPRVVATRTEYPKALIDLLLKKDVQAEVNIAPTLGVQEIRQLPMSYQEDQRDKEAIRTFPSQSAITPNSTHLGINSNNQGSHLMEGSTEMNKTNKKKSL